MIRLVFLYRGGGNMSTDVFTAEDKTELESIQDAIEDLWPRSAKVFPDREVKSVLTRTYMPGHMKPFETNKVVGIDVDKINQNIQATHTKEA